MFEAWRAHPSERALVAEGQGRILISMCGIIWERRIGLHSVGGGRLSESEMISTSSMGRAYYELCSGKSGAGQGG